MPDLRSIPGQLSTDPNVLPSAKAIAAIADIAKARTTHFRVTLGEELLRGGYTAEEQEDYRLLCEIEERKGLLESEQAHLRVLFRRWDNLYYPEQLTTGGADHWPEGEKPGRVHVSINTPPVYVDIPASLQAVVPVENYVAQSSAGEDRESAARAERLYFEWKDADGFELKVHKGCVVKGLYGFTFGKVYWDAIEERPTVQLIDSPENLYVGWGASDYSRIDFAIYCYGLSGQTIRETFGLSVDYVEKADGYHPVVRGSDHADPIRTVYPDGQSGQLRGARVRNAYEELQVEVYDYWYKKPRGKGKKPAIWNAIFVGNRMVKNARHAEYDDIPYLPLPNTYIPGSPYGRPELYDIEQLLREKDERLTNAGQMIASMTDGQRWQLVGAEAPDEVPPNAIPLPNKVATPGPGNEIKAIQPFVAEYAAEDYLKRLDMEMERVTGLNAYLMGQAPREILGSSRAMNALVANYAARISMKRALLYEWRKKTWVMAAKVWEAKDPKVKAILDGQYRLDVKPPELTPRDQLEVAQIAMSLVQNRLWSGERAMDATGVEDPADEKTVIREEQTDIALNPGAVQAQATVVATMQQLGMTAPNQAQTANTQRTLNPPVAGTQSLNQPGNAANPPAESVPANAQAANGAPGGNAVIQTMTQEGEASGRILTQTDLG